MLSKLAIQINLKTKNITGFKKLAGKKFLDKEF